MYVGTAYDQNFQFDKKCFWKIGLNLNWSKYSLYYKGIYQQSIVNNELRTFSISSPMYFGYEVFSSKPVTVNLFTGPEYELILTSSMDGESFSGINNFQIALTAGVDFRIYSLFGLRLAYSYYPTPLLSSGVLYRSAFNISIGF